MAGKDFTEIDSNTYLAWNNSLTRTLRELGLKPAKSNSAPSLQDYLAQAYPDADGAAA